MSIMHDPRTGAWHAETIATWRRWWPSATAGVALVVGLAVRWAVPQGGRLTAASAVALAALLVLVVVPELGITGDVRQALTRRRTRRTGVVRARVVVPRHGSGTWLPAAMVWAGCALAVRWPVLPVLVVLALLGVVGQRVALARTHPDRVERLARQHLDAEVESTRRGVAELWARTLASTTWGADKRGRGGGGPLVGTTLRVTDRAPDGSWHGTLDLGPGVTDVDDVVAARRTIGKVWAVPAGQVLVRPGATEAVAEVRVFRRDPLAPTLPWRGPTITRSGRVDVGVFADGTPARSLLWTPRGARHSRVTGVTGSGKSAPSEVRAAELILARRGVVIVLDPDQGESLPGLSSRGVLTARGVDECLEAVAGLDALLEARLRRQRPTRPTRAHPLVWVIAEESPEILTDKRAAESVAKFVKRGRKAWIGISLVAQHYTLAQLGGDSALRSQASGGDLFLFRQSERISGPAAESLPSGVAPHEIPEFGPAGNSTVGYGFAPACGSSLPFRATFMSEESWEIFDRLDAALTAGGEGRDPSPRVELPASDARVLAEHAPSLLAPRLPVDALGEDAHPSDAGAPREGEGEPLEVGQ